MTIEIEQWDGYLVANGNDDNWGFVTDWKDIHELFHNIWECVELHYTPIQTQVNMPIAKIFFDTSHFIKSINTNVAKV